MACLDDTNFLNSEHPLANGPMANLQSFPNSEFDFGFVNANRNNFNNDLFNNVSGDSSFLTELQNLAPLQLQCSHQGALFNTNQSGGGGGVGGGLNPMPHRTTTADDFITSTGLVQPSPEQIQILEARYSLLQISPQF